MRTFVLTLAGALALTSPALAEMKMKHGHEGMAPADYSAIGGETAVIGEITIDAPFARATLPNQPVAGGFMTLTNGGEVDDRLIAVASPAAARMEIHEMKMDGDVMRMREVEGGLIIPAGEIVSLVPGGYHIMFMDLVGPMVSGEMAEVTLTFERAGEVTLTVPIVDRNAIKGAQPSSHGGHGS